MRQRQRLTTVEQDLIDANNQLVDAHNQLVAWLVEQMKVLDKRLRELEYKVWE